MILLAANVFALAACFFVWDMGVWYRARFQGGSFTTIPGVIAAHVGMVVIYVWVMWAFLALLAYPVPQG